MPTLLDQLCQGAQLLEDDLGVLTPAHEGSKTSRRAILGGRRVRVALLPRAALLPGEG